MQFWKLSKKCPFLPPCLTRKAVQQLFQIFTISLWNSQDDILKIWGCYRPSPWLCDFFSDCTFCQFCRYFTVFQGLRGPGTPCSKFMKILPIFFFHEVEHFYWRGVLILRHFQNHGAFDAPYWRSSRKSLNSTQFPSLTYNSISEK